MTDEELLDAAKDIVRELMRSCDITPDEHAFVVERLRSIARRARDEALEEVARVAEDPETPYEGICEACHAPFDVQAGIAAAVRGLKGKA